MAAPGRAATAWRVARAELRQLRRSGAIALVTALLAVLLVASAVVAWRADRAFEAQRARYQGTVEAQWGQQPARHPHRVSHYGYLVFRPRSPLGFFDSGVSAHTGSTLFLEAHRQNSMNFADAAQADAPLRFGGVSLALVLQLLVPLIVFVAAAGIVAREREDGTLALVLAQGVRWRTILAGKATALLVAGVGVVLPAAVVVAVLLAGSRDAAWTADAWISAGGLLAAHVVYLGLCAMIGVLVSALAPTAREATLALVGLWLVLWVVVPRTAPALGAAAVELPTRAQFEADVERRTRAIGDSHNPNDPNFAAFKQALLTREGVTRLEDLPSNVNGLLMIEGERLTTEAYREARAALTAALDRQHQRVRWAGLISPFVAMRLASMALTGTSVAHADDFEAQAERYRFALVQHLNALHAEEVALADDRYEATGGGSDAPTRKRIDAHHWATAPTFSYEPPPAALGFTAAAPGIGALAAWLVGLAVVLGRLRPRVA